MEMQIDDLFIAEWIIYNDVDFIVMVENYGLQNTINILKLVLNGCPPIKQKTGNLNV